VFAKLHPRRTKSIPYIVTSLHPYFLFSKSLSLNLFADPHPLNPYGTIFCKNMVGEGHRRRSRSLKSFRCHTSGISPVSLAIATLPKTSSRKSFPCHTSETPRGQLLSTVDRRSRPCRDCQPPRGSSTEHESRNTDHSSQFPPFAFFSRSLRTGCICLFSSTLNFQLSTSSVRSSTDTPVTKHVPRRRSSCRGVCLVE
jgi:hypothetical protein